MKKNHFYIAYAGNKRTEVEKITNSLNLDDIDTIIEPFCGTSALSVYLYHNHPKGKDFKYIINDNDKNLIKLYKMAKNETKFNKFIDKVNKLCFDKDNNFITKERYLEIINNGSYEGWFISKKYYNMRPGLYPLNRITKKYTNDKDLMNEFIRNADLKILNKDAFEVVDKHRNNEKTLIFLDPPYINLCNSFYECGGKNIYEYLSYENPNNFKCLLVSVLNDNWICRLIFRHYNIIEYEKLYQASKRKVIHLLISNR
jgi:site-specific DNA-adenine methylase